MCAAAKGHGGAQKAEHTLFNITRAHARVIRACNVS
nr:MAG TPA: hypothetical protein [Caudoviricetes sp.]